LVPSTSTLVMGKKEREAKTPYIIPLAFDPSPIKPPSSIGKRKMLIKRNNKIFLTFLF